jgi:hypothetical protein
MKIQQAKILLIIAGRSPVFQEGMMNSIDVSYMNETRIYLSPPGLVHFWSAVHLYPSLASTQTSNLWKLVFWFAQGG